MGPCEDGEAPCLGLGVCLGRDAVVWRESPSAVLGRHYSDGTKTQHGVSCCVWGLVRTVRPHVWGLGCVWAGMLWCGVNRRLRCWERTTATSSRRSAAFRAQGRREMKQVVQPAQRGAMRPVETWTMVSVEAGSGVGCPDFVQSRATHGCVNRRLRRRARTTATSPRRSAAFRAQDGWRWQGWGCWKGQGCCIVRLRHGGVRNSKTP